MSSTEIISTTMAAFVAVLFWTVVVSKLIAFIAGGGVSLVVKTLSIEAGTESTPTRIEIAGRREGLIAFFLTLLGLSPTTTLVVDERESICKTTGLLGVTHQSVPMDRVAQVTSGSKVGFEYIVSAAITSLIGLMMILATLMRFDLVGLIGVAILTVVFAGISLLLYRLNKRFYVGVFPQGGWPMLLVFKPNVIEGVELNLDRALEIAAHIRTLVVNSRPSAFSTSARSSLQAMWGSPSADRGHYDEPPTAQSLLRIAQNHIRAGEREDAIVALKHLVKEFAGTPEAEQAAKSLARAGL